MSQFFEALAAYQFLQYAVIGGLLASIACGVIGSYVVVRRIGSLAGGISHAVLGGMGIALFFGFAPLSGALVAALVAALLIGWISLRAQQHEDVMINALWSIGMALGVICIAKTPGYNVDLMSYLFGSILMISGRELYMMAGLDIVILMLVALYYKQLQAICFDEQFARLRGVNVTFFYLLLLCLVALTVVVLIQVVGLILVIALITLPAATARQFSRSLGTMMVIAVCVGMVANLGGLLISYQPDLPSGATIILLAGAIYVGALLFKSLRVAQ